MNNSQQLSLEIVLDDQATFENFYAPRGSTHYLATMILQDSHQQYACLVGSTGSGLSHLLQAACQKRPFERHNGAIYLPMKELQDYQPQQILDGLHQLELVCLDDLHLVSNQTEWQVPLFNFFNDCKQSGARLVFASQKAPDELGVSLADLLSRLKSGLIHRLADYSDEDLRRLLQLRANVRGMYLSDEVAKFLMHRLRRDTKSLMNALETLDRTSLQEQRRLTLPFVKSALGLKTP